MILTNIDNVERYVGLNKGIDLAIMHMLSTDFLSLECGKYDLDEENYFFIQDFKTNDESEQKYEAHKKRIDIQMPIIGTEGFRVQNVKKLEPLEEFSEVNDIGFYKEKTEKGQLFYLNRGEMVILFPEDAHKPGIALNSPMKARKVVYKLMDK